MLDARELSRTSASPKSNYVQMGRVRWYFSILKDHLFITTFTSSPLLTFQFAEGWMTVVDGLGFWWLKQAWKEIATR